MYYGYNAAVSSVPYVKMIQDMIASGSPVHMIMTEPQNGHPTSGDFDFLWRVYDALAPVYGDKTRLIWRIYSTKEGNWSLYNIQTISALFNRPLPPRTIVDALANEPNLNGMDWKMNREFVEHELRNLRRFKELGVTYAPGAFSVGTPHETLIKNGVYDPLLAEAEYLSMHLYNIFPFEAGEIWGWETIEKTEENRRRIREQYLDEPKKWAEGYAGWLLRRPQWFLDRNPNVRILVTESPFDNTNPPEPHKSAWRNSFGISMYNRDPRGFFTYHDQFKWLFPELTLDQVMEMCLIHVGKNILYDQNVDFIEFFGYNRQWGYPSGSHKEYGGNIEDPRLTEFRANGMRRVNMALASDTVPDSPTPQTDLIWANWYQDDTDTGQDNVAVETTLIRNATGETVGVLTEEPIPVDIAYITDDPGEYLTDWSYTGSYTGAWVVFSRIGGDIGMLVVAEDYIDMTRGTTDEDDLWVLEFPFTKIVDRATLEDTIELLVTVQDLIQEAQNLDIDEDELDNDDLLILFAKFLAIVSELQDGGMETANDIFEFMIDYAKEKSLQWN